MAHNLNINKGKASMFYVGDVPWHALGTKLENPATSEEAIKAAGLDYTVRKQPLFTKHVEDPAFATITPYIGVEGHFSTVRTDTHVPLGVVGSRYLPIQNRDAFRFFDSLVGEGEAIYHTAGVLGKGERIWILAQLPGYIKVGGHDIVRKYLLLTNSHDGSSLVRAKLTPIRVVCNNTLSAALSGNEREVRIRHTASAQFNLDQAHKVLSLSNHLYDQLDSIFNAMKNTRLTRQGLNTYAHALVSDNPVAESTQRTANIREAIYELNEIGKGAEMCRGTVWGAYNAVTEYTDHVMSSRDGMKALNSMWFGSGEILKKRAFKLAMEMSS
jgi:phage/plasmid-like protein (TIGR03299 family)